MRIFPVVFACLAGGAGAQDPSPSSVLDTTPGRPVRAERTPLFADLHELTPGAGGFSACFALGDLDGDGDLDAFVGRSSISTNDAWLNDGGGRFLAGEIMVEPIAAVTIALALGDVDGDGDVDAYSGNYTDVDRIYINRSGRRFSARDGALPVAVVAERTPAVAFADLSGDGNLDAYLSQTQDRLLLGLGRGDFFDATTNLPVEAVTTSTIQFGDVDDDGDVDVLLGGDRTRLYRNDGFGGFADVTAQLPSDAGTDIALADVDDDGDPDAVSATVLYLNDGTGVFADASGQLPVGPDLLAQAVDFEGDGDPDLIGRSILYLNDGNGFFTASRGAPTASGSYALGDLDADTDTDLLVAYDHEVAVHLNDGLGFTEIEPGLPEFPFRSRAAVDASIADMDGDGDRDVLTCYYELDMYDEGVAVAGFFANDGRGRFPAIGSGVPYAPGISTGIRAADVDDDGENDVLVSTRHCTGHGGNITLFRRQNGGFENGYSAFSPADTNDFDVGDVDDDGDVDVLQGSQGGFPFRPDAVLLNDGAGIFSPAPGFPALVQDTTEVELGDLDMDGDLDAVVAGQELRIYRNDGGTWTDLTAHQPYPVTHQVEVGDTDRDGDPDLLLTFDTAAWIYENVGGASFVPFLLLRPLTGRDGAVLLDADVDGDLDALVSTAVFLNRGGGKFAAAIPAGFTVSEKAGYGDLDGDGDPDVFSGARLLNNLTTHLAWRHVPSIHKPLAMDLHGEPDAPWTLLFSTRPGNAVIPFRGRVLLAPGRPVVFTTGTLGPSGHDVVIVDVPPEPSLVGRSTVWQALLGVPPRPTNRDVTTFTRF